MIQEWTAHGRGLLPKRRIGNAHMTTKYVPPAITETAFNCPHCGALTTQFWADVYAQPLKEDQRTPIQVVKGAYDQVLDDPEFDAETKKYLRDFEANMLKGEPFDHRLESGNYVYVQMNNTSL